MTDPTCAASPSCLNGGCPSFRTVVPAAPWHCDGHDTAERINAGCKVGNYGGISRHVSGFRPSALRRSNQYWFKTSRKE